MLAAVSRSRRGWPRDAAISSSRTRSPTPRTRSRSRASGASTLQVETKPDLTPVSEADRAAEEAIRRSSHRRARGEGVLGEEFGDDGGDAKLDRRPDRRDDELRARRPDLGDAVRAPAGRRSRPRGRLGARARPPLVGAPGGRRVRSRERCAVSRVSSLEAASVSTTSRARMPDGWADDRAARLVEPWLRRLLGALPRRRGRGRRRDRRPDMQVWDYSAVQLLVEEAGGRARPSKAPPPTPTAASSRRTAPSTTRSLSLLAVRPGSDRRQPTTQAPANARVVLIDEGAKSSPCVFRRGPRRARATRRHRRSDRRGNSRSKTRSYTTPSPRAAHRYPPVVRSVRYIAQLRTDAVRSRSMDRVKRLCQRTPRRSVRGCTHGLARVQPPKAAAQREFTQAKQRVEVRGKKRVLEDAPPLSRACSANMSRKS